MAKNRLELVPREKGLDITGPQCGTLDNMKIKPIVGGIILAFLVFAACAVPPSVAHALATARAHDGVID